MNLLKLMDELQNLQERFPEGWYVEAYVQRNELVIKVFTKSGFVEHTSFGLSLSRERIIYTLEAAMEAEISNWVRECINTAGGK